jgi:hypothetical protein
VLGNVDEHQADEELSSLKARYDVAAAAAVDARTPAEKAKAEKQLDSLDGESAARRRSLALAQAAERGRRLQAVQEEQRRREDERHAAEHTVKELASQRFALAKKLDELTNQQVATLGELLAVCDRMSNAAIPLGGKAFGWAGRHIGAWLSGRLLAVDRRTFELAAPGLRDRPLPEMERELLRGLLSEGGEKDGEW